MKQMSAKRKAKGAGYKRACDEVDQRSRGMCEADSPACPPRAHYAHHHHHVHLRSRGGLDTKENLIHVCTAGHDWIHANPTAATELGLMR